MFSYTEIIISIFVSYVFGNIVGYILGIMHADMQKRNMIRKINRRLIKITEGYTNDNGK